MAVVKLEIRARGPYANGMTFGEVGAYEQIDGIARFAVDPAHEANASIVDLDRAERGPDMVADEAQGLGHARPVVRRRHLEGRPVAHPPHARGPDHLPGGKDPVDPGRLLPRLEREHRGAGAGAGLVPGPEIGLALPVGELLGAGGAGGEKG